VTARAWVPIFIQFPIGNRAEPDGGDLIPIDAGGRLSPERAFAEQFNPAHSVAECPLLDRIDAECISEEFKSETHCEQHNFENHLEVSIL